ncbi:protein RRP5 homolog isoform X2 [Hypomesus transpacificus]|uniref:protein RRP5 homolog isoform X2 n=1 Tax=Hypomesus transpacificus TaxID=137520 RepID=UPI001F081CC8|nr:protein RRP5 homolog isoform X2 [Hypomesus transpacificus]
MASLDEDFPRGGTGKKAETKAKPVRHHTEVDNLFQTHEPAETKKRKGEKRNEGKNVAKKQKTSKEETLKLNAAAKVEILHLKSLKVGTLVLGCIKEVTDFEVMVSLPSGLMGYLAISNISDSYTKMVREQLDSDTEEIFSLPDLFSPGMLLRCSVVRLNITKKGTVSIQLSINPKEVNKGLTTSCLSAGMILSGCVDSVEDHGYLVDIGVSGTKAFLPKQAATDQPIPKELKVGQCVVSLLEEVKNEGRVIRLSTCPRSVAQSYADIKHGWTLTNLLPGLLVKAQIKKVTIHGLILEFLSSFSGMVDFMHMEPSCSYNEGDEVKACVLYLEPSSRLLGLSLRGHLLQPGGDLAQVTSERIGEVLEGCKMTSLHHYSGAILELPDSTQVFVHRNHMKEPKDPFNMNRVMAKAEHTCRIMDYSTMEQMHYVSLRMSVIKSPFFRYHDIHPGQVVEGTVINLNPSGMTVKLTEHIRGMVPKTHLSDIILKNPERKYTEGMKVKCRVLAVDPQRKSLTLTRKKALVESSLPLFLSFADARPGRISHGHIICVKDFGCIVRFYGDVKGLVPVRELSTELVIVPEKMFFVGQVVKAKVLNCDLAKEKLLLSFKAVAGGDTEAPPKPQFDFEIGKKVEARLVAKVLGALEVAILPEEVPALLPISHLSDHVSNCPLLFEALQEGDTISNLACVNHNKQHITLTKKPVLRASMEDGPVAREFSDVKVGMQLIGWIKNIMPYGVFVEFPCGLVGLAPKSAMSDKFISDTTGPFQLGQTVGAKVTNLDEEKGRFLVSLKVSEVMAPEGDAQARLLQGLLERRAVADMMANKEDSELHQQLSVVTLGQRLKLSVEQVKEDESVSLVCDDLKGATVLATKHHSMGVKVSPGQKVNAVVLHVDPLSTQVHVSLLPKLVAKRKSVEEGAKYTARVQHADKDFAVISLGDTAQLTVVQTTNNLNDSFRFETEKLLPGRFLAVSVTDPSCEDLEGLPLVEWDSKVQRGAAADQAGPRGTGRHRYGDLVKGKVKAVRPTCVQVELEGGATGSVHVSEVQDGACLGTFPTSAVKLGSEVTARVIGGREACSHRYLPFSHPNFTYFIPELSLLPSKLQEDVVLEPVKRSLKEELMTYQVGQKVTCFVSKYYPEKKCLEVTISPSLTGTVDILSMVTDPKDLKHPEKLYKLGQAVGANVVQVSLKPLRLSLSLTDVPKLENGSVTVGIVQSVQPQVGLGVRLPLGAKGTVAVVDLLDSYKRDPLQAFSKGQLVRCCVLSEKSGQWQLSLRPSRLSPDKPSVVKDPEVRSAGGLTPGQILRGYVKSVGEHGVFIRLSTNITGRAQFQHATKYFSSPDVFAKHVPVNTLLTTKVLHVDTQNEQVDLSLLSGDTGKADLLPESLGLPLRLLGEEKEKYDAKRKRKSSESQPEPVEKPAKKKKGKKEKTEDIDSGVEVYFREEEDGGVGIEEKSNPPKGKPAAAPARLQVSGGFSWDAALSTLKPASATPEGDDSSEGEEEQGQRQKKTRHERHTEKRQAEKALSERETELMDPALRPQDAGSFERLLLASPDSSLLWLQYMAFHLQATQIEQARAVAERALKTISFREEQEKLNVWVALLNLENLYGSEESLKKAFERALQFCEPMPVYQQLADIYAKSGKTKEAENLYKKIVKRFRQEKAVWLSYASFLLQQGQSDACSALLQRALNSLPAKENVDVIAKFAQLEFRYGDVEKGKVMLDKVLSSYPKRTDLWSVFIDLMVKHGSQKEIRALFDRVIHLSVAVKRIKFFFKRYLEYEKKNGTPESIQAVKEKALEYVENKATEAAS